MHTLLQSLSACAGHTGSEFDGITVESYFKQFGYSIKQPNRRTGANLPLNTPEDVTEEGSILHTPSASPKVITTSHYVTLSWHNTLL